MEEHERSRALGIGRRVEDGHGAAIVSAEHDRFARAGVVEHRAQVLHARLESRELAVTVGDARSALVEENQPEASRELLVEVAPVRRLPGVDEVGAEVRHEDEVGLAVADDLISDRRTATPRVVDLGLHASSLFDGARRHNGNPDARFARRAR